MYDFYFAMATRRDPLYLRRKLEWSYCVATSQALLHDPAAFGREEEREAVAAAPSVTHPRGTPKTLWQVDQQPCRWIL